MREPTPRVTVPVTHPSGLFCHLSIRAGRRSPFSPCASRGRRKGALAKEREKEGRPILPREERGRAVLLKPHPQPARD